MTSPAFLIRGHHLNHYAELASWRSDPRDLAKDIVEGRLRDSDGNPESQAYTHDVIGTSPEQAKLVAGRLRAVFTRFIELEKEDVVVITTGERDHMCESCIIGNHCRQRGLEMSADTEYGRLQVYEQDFGDMNAIGAFKKLAERLTTRGDIDPALGSYTTAYVPEPTPDAVPIIESNMVVYEAPLQTSAGYVKAVLAHWSLAQQLRY